jgi:hypothetical protein
MMMMMMMNCAFYVPVDHCIVDPNI